MKYLCILPIDKLLGVWYNGSSARLGRRRAAKKTNGKSAHEFSRRRLMPSQKNRKEKGRAACVSCVSTTFFQPAWSGSHLYPANRNTLRSRTLSSRSYPTLVGLAFVASALLPSLCLYYSPLHGQHLHQHGQGEQQGIYVGEV